MRDVNFFSVFNNKAAANMTPTMYDRRALDCPYDRPLVNSLSSLCVLVSSSQVIRESLATDGGIDRLVSILKSCKGMHSRDLLTSWKWSLALQCLSSVGVRGSEAVRRRVVEADIVPILATVLDNFLEAIEKLRLYHDFFVKAQSQNSYNALNAALTPDAQSRLESEIDTREQRQLEQGRGSEQERHRQQTRQDQFMFDSGIDVDTSEMLASVIDAAVTSTEAADTAVQQDSENQQQFNIVSHTAINTNSTNSNSFNSSAYQNRLHYHMHHHHRHHHRYHHSHSHSHSHSQQHSHISATSSTANGDNTISNASALDSSNAMEIDERPLQQQQGNVELDDAQTSSGEEASFYGNENGSLNTSADVVGDIVQSGDDMADVASDSQPGESNEVNGVNNGSTLRPVRTTSLFTDRSDTVSSTSVTAHGSTLLGTGATPLFSNNIAAPLPTANQAVDTITGTRTLPDQAAPPNLPQGPVHGDGDSTNSPSMFPSFLGNQDNLPREEDVLMSLQLLAYVSKYVYLRSYFQNTHIVPSLSMRTDLPIDDVKIDSKDPSGIHDTSLFPDDQSYIASEYKLPSINVFQLVERFTTRAYMGDLHYWACVIMRNSCRKDESRGGVRQCGYFECGKWEEYPKQFAKCRRCRRTKYCSKSCQSKAWYFHRHWCVPPE
ncbi:hypothetical protein V1511DRAFT_458946 [Dipodascopsis uninucleata]